MNLPHLVGIQLILYATLWALCARILVTERRAVLHYLAYAAAAGFAVMLISGRPSGPVWWTHTVASIANMLSLVAARRGVEVFLKVRARDLEHGVTAVLGSALFVWIGPDDASLRVALGAALAAAILLGAVWSCWKPLRREFGLRFSLMASVPLAAMLVINLDLGASALRGHVVAVEGTGMPQAITWTVTLVSAAAFNFLFLFLLGLRMHQRLHRLATQDPLTGLLNRRGMQAALQAEWRRSKRYQLPFAVISLDVDHFKRVNDQHGHDAGDRVLMAVSEVLRNHVRESDQVARMGGEEFLVLLPAARAETEGVALATRLRVQLNQVAVVTDAQVKIPVTASWGVSGVLPKDASQDDVLRRADEALYQGKRSGRDRVVLFGLQEIASGMGTAGTDAGALAGGFGDAGK
jgi:diguanylate cyclase (GGDEF)-like protein